MPCHAALELALEAHACPPPRPCSAAPGDCRLPVEPGLRGRQGPGQGAVAGQRAAVRPHLGALQAGGPGRRQAAPHQRPALQAQRRQAVSGTCLQGFFPPHTHMHQTTHTPLRRLPALTHPTHPHTPAPAAAPPACLRGLHARRAAAGPSASPSGLAQPAGAPPLPHPSPTPALLPRRRYTRQLARAEVDQGVHNPLTHEWLRRPDAGLEREHRKASDRVHGYIGIVARADGRGTFDPVRWAAHRGGGGSREQGAGSREQGAGSREQGAGSREQGAGSREGGGGSREGGGGRRERGGGRPAHPPAGALRQRGCGVRELLSVNRPLALLTCGHVSPRMRNAGACGGHRRQARRALLSSRLQRRHSWRSPHRPGAQRRQRLRCSPGPRPLLQPWPALPHPPAPWHRPSGPAARLPGGDQPATASPGVSYPPGAAPAPLAPAAATCCLLQAAVDTSARLDALQSRAQLAAC
jgi:hypothetical protein